MDVAFWSDEEVKEEVAGLFSLPKEDSDPCGWKKYQNTAECKYFPDKWDPLPPNVKAGVGSLRTFGKVGPTSIYFS